MYETIKFCIWTFGKLRYFEILKQWQIFQHLYNIFIQLSIIVFLYICIIKLFYFIIL